MRAEVEGDSGVAAVNLDALEFEDPTAALLVSAYRCWLGSGSDDEVEPEPKQTINLAARHTSRAAELNAQIDEVIRGLGELDYEEIEQWIGDDDPWGRNKEYWSDGAYRYQELVALLEPCPDEIRALYAAGGRAQANEVLDRLFEALRAAHFGHFCPDEVALVARPAFQLLGEIGTDVAPAPIVVERMVRLIDEFGYSLWLRRFVEDAPTELEEPLIQVLESRLDGESDRWKATDLASNICTLRVRRGEVDLLLERFEPGNFSEQDAVSVATHLAGEDELSDALWVLEEWLAAQSRNATTSSAEALRRRLLSRSGRESEAAAALWSAFEARPTAELYRELRALPGVDVERMSKVVEDQPDLLVELARDGEPPDEAVERICELGWNDLRDVSSWTLQDAGPNLAAHDHPEAALEVFLALGWRHVDRGKTKYYHLALDAFVHAHELCVELDREEFWAEQADAIVAQHGRKRSFMAGFRAVFPGS